MISHRLIVVHLMLDSFSSGIKVTTGTEAANDGNLDLLVNTGNGKGYFQVTPSGRFWEIGEVVIDQCYVDLVGVQVRGPTNNAWTGR